MDSIAIPPRVLAGDFGGWLRDAMRARRISTRMLAVRTGLDHSTIYRLTTEDRQPTLPTAIALFRILAIQPQIVPTSNERPRLVIGEQAHDGDALAG